MAGFPTESTFVDALRLAWDTGCDLLEVGVPFSDPIADGPVIQKASQQCLERGMTIRRALDLIDRAAVGVPVILMSYLNPILAYGCLSLARDARAVGVSSVIVPDLPASKTDRPRTLHGIEPMSPSDRAGGVLRAGGLEWVQLAAPTTDKRRLHLIGRQTQGFLYAVTVAGVTGARDELPTQTAAFLHRAKAATRRPVLAGFGIASAESAARCAAHCDGVIVGSALVEILQLGRGGSGSAALARFLRKIRRAL